MKKYQKINLIVFLCMIAVTTFLFYISETTMQASLDGKPWHLQPMVHEDSLSNEYKSQYKILGKQRILQQFKDTSKLQIFILVDAWGVPMQESVLASDVSFLKMFPMFLHCTIDLPIEQNMPNERNSGTISLKIFIYSEEILQNIIGWST